MSLFDALLLDPLRVNVWIAARTDNNQGSGTQNDPYDAGGATPAAKFDAIMNGLPSTYPVRVHLGPGTFYTNGYADGVAGGWQAMPRMKIVGSGIDVTTLTLAGGSNAHFYTIGHALRNGQQPNPADFFEVSDLTIDCNLGAMGATAAAGAVRVMGNHARIRRVKVINWGTLSTSRPCFVASAIACDPVSGWVAEDCGIEECIAINPAASNIGPVTVFHAGGYEQAGYPIPPDTVPPTDPTALGLAPIIRNCFADAGQATPWSTNVEIRCLSMGWCKAGIMEGNQAHNMSYGVFQEATSAQDLVVRNNWFKNVKKGIVLGNSSVGWSPTQPYNLVLNGTTATVQAPNSNLVPGNLVGLSSHDAPAYDGLIVKVTNADSSQFTFNTSKTVNSATISSVFKVNGVSTVIAEGNVIELALSTLAPPPYLIGIHLMDFWGNSNPLQDSSYPAYVYGTVVIRDNKIRYVDGQLSGGYVGYPINIASAADLVVRNNVVESGQPVSTVQPLQNQRCGAVTYFNNPVTALMHLAAAVPTKPGHSQARACVVVAGGREPTHWEAYPQHQFIHTVGALKCCEIGGCWKSRVVPLLDGDEKDRPENLCSDVVGNIPRCMDMVTVDEVIHRIELYFTGGVMSYLGPEFGPIPEHFLRGVASC